MSPLLLLPLALLARLDSPVTDRAEALAKVALKQGGDARGAAPLIRLHGLLDEVDDLNLLAEPYANLVFRRNTHPDVRALARYFYAELERARGRTSRGGDMLEPLGFMQDFYVVGGFDNEGKQGCDTDWGPEAAVDLKATYPAKTREAGWRRLPAKNPDGYVDLSTLIRPQTEVVAYALGFLQAEKETSVELSIGASGAFRLFVNGVKALSEDRYNLPRPDQARVQVRLRKGVNRVMLKVCQESGPLGFYLRQERARGAPAQARPVLPDPIPPLEKGPAPAPSALATLTDLLERQVRQSPNDPELRADYATVLEATLAFPAREHTALVEAQKAADAAPTNAALQLGAALREREDANARRRYLERALQADPKFPWARLELARHELAMDHPELALAFADGLLAEFPRFAGAYLVKARAHEALQERVSALATLESAFEKLQHVPPIAREGAAASRRMERLPEAEGRLRMAMALRFDDNQSRRSLASQLADVGRIDDAAGLWDQVLALEPYDNGARIRLGELLLANGQEERGLKAFADARLFGPDDADVHEREGRALLHLGKKDESLAAITRSLTLRPQNPGLKELSRVLRGEDSSLGAPNALPLGPLLEEAKGITGEDAVVLAEVTSVRVQASGLSSRFSQLAVKVLSQRAVDNYRELPIVYSPDRQEVKVLRARITRPDGSVLDSFGDQDRHMNEPWTGMYYDARARVLSFPQLAAGDVLEVQWRLEDNALDNLLSDYWGDVDVMQSLHKKLRYRYVVEMPAGRQLFWNKAALPAWVTASQSPGPDGRTVYRFEARNVPRVVPEPNMPGWAEVAATLHLSTYQTWDQVGRYWWGLVREQLTPNDELKKTVDKVLNGIDRKDTRKVVSALYSFVVTNTRYVALEFGIHGFKPYRVDRVLARRFGDCKDKASLIVAMLKLAGVESKLVLLRMRHLGRLGPEPASLAAFNHAIAYVPSLGLYLDGTAEFHGPAELPASDRVANVLIVEPDKASVFSTTPEAKADDNATTLSLEVALKTDGSAEASGESVVVGQAAPELRRAFQAPATRKNVFEQGWAQTLPGLTVHEVNVSDTAKLDVPLSVTFRLSTPRYAEAGPGLLRFFPLGAGRAFTQVLAPLAERKSEAVYPGVWANTFTFRYALPGGYAIEAMPEDVEERSPFGRVKLSARMESGKLVVRGEIALEVARVSPTDYPAFRAWLGKVDQTFSRKLTARQQGGQSASR
jgi:cellulose synthase operon protein C